MIIPHVDFRIEGCEAEVWFNDFPIHRISALHSPVFLTKPVAELVRDGDNMMTVVPFPGGTPSTSRQAQGVPLPLGARFEASLVFYEEGDFPGGGAGKEMMALRFESTVGAPAVMAQPVVKKWPLQYGGVPWGWLRAQKLVLNRETKGLIERAVQMAYTAFAERDADFFLRFGHVYFSEYAAAYPGMSAIRREQRFRASLAGHPEDSNWRIAPLDHDSFDFRLCADSRLVEVIDRNFRPVLRSDSTPYPFQMFLGMLDGRLQMLR